MRFWLAFSTLLFLAACQPQTVGPLHPLEIATDKGTRPFMVEVVDQPASLQRGLMFRKELAADRGMLFVFPDNTERSFWMKNTYIPLDILFIRHDGRIATIAENAKPFDETPIPSGQAVTKVLEIAGGQAEIQGIKVGDKMTFKGEKDAR